MGNEETLGTENDFGQDCYDAIWILALALNKTMNGKATYTLLWLC